jgi:hypothetical protein
MAGQEGQELADIPLVSFRGLGRQLAFVAT